MADNLVHHVQTVEDTDAIVKACADAGVQLMDGKSTGDHTPIELVPCLS